MKLNIAIIIFSLLSPITFAETINLPDDIGQDESPNPQAGHSSKLYSKHAMPSSKDQSEWVDWAMNLLESGRKNELAYATQVNPALTAQHTRVAARCIWLDSAFKFQRIADNLYDVSCWAGSRKEVTHAIWYRFKVEYSSDCVNPNKIEAYFKNPQNMSERGGIEFVRLMNKACVLKVNPEVPLQTPITKVRKFDANWFRETKCNEEDEDKIEPICKDLSKIPTAGSARSSRPERNDSVGTTGLGGSVRNPFENAIPRDRDAK